MAIAIETEMVGKLLRSGTHVVDLELDGKVEKSLVKDVQWDTFSSHVLHLDFLRVDPNERVTVEVPIHLRGTAPGVVAGGVLEQPHHSVEIECLAVEIPDFIQVRIGALNIGDVVHVSDLTEVPDGVAILDPPETVLVSVVHPSALEVPEVVPTEEAPTEPALAGRREEAKTEEA